MGKSTAASKKPGKEKVKSKAKAKAKAASQPSVVQPVEDANDVSIETSLASSTGWTTEGWAEVSKFITALKYKAKNPKDPQAQGAQMVLEDRGLDQHDPIYKYIYILCDQLDLYIFDWSSSWNCWTPTCMKPILFSSSVPLNPCPAEIQLHVGRWEEGPCVQVHCWRWDQGQPSADSLQYGIQQLH